MSANQGKLKEAFCCMDCVTKTVGRVITTAVIVQYRFPFRDKNTMTCPGAMAFRRYFPATTRLLSFRAKSRTSLPTIYS